MQVHAGSVGSSAAGVLRAFGVEDSTVKVKVGDGGCWCPSSAALTGPRLRMPNGKAHPLRAAVEVAVTERQQASDPRVRFGPHGEARWAGRSHFLA